MSEFVRPRPEFPKRAVVTSGMPYGNKLLHHGHIGMILRADIFSRFLRDRIGKENVIFVSGTDCYGAPATESFRKLKESGSEEKSLTSYVERNHIGQKEIIKKFDIDFNFFGASALGRAKEIHEETSKWFIEKLLKANMLSTHSSWQFYDEKHHCLLNGRQVIGKCPIEGCQSEKGYADECDLCHSYLPQDLINPISQLSGETPKLVQVKNLYFNLENCTDILTEWIDSIDRKGDTPAFMVKEIREFFKKPEVYIKREFFDKFDEIKCQLPEFTESTRNEKSPSLTIVFDKLTDREQACQIFANNGIRYRTGKTLTPFRLTGDLAWGVPCPDVLGISGQTFYVWPESLWAPISFTKTYLEKIGKDENEWKKYWCSQDAQVYQFLGEDNLYFYGPAQQALFLATQGQHAKLKADEGQLQVTKINPIKSILYMNSKASSSGTIKPPMAEEFLKYYTAEQFRMHFLAMNLTNNNVSLNPKYFNPNAKEDEQDEMVKEGNLLTNVYNRILRTLFYSTQKSFDGVLPTTEIDEKVMTDCSKTILDVERFMHDKKFHQVYNALDVFIRNINKYWVKEVATADTEEKMAKLTANTLQMIFVANTLLHPIAPNGTENVADYIGLDKEKCFNWEYIFGSVYDVLDAKRGKKLIFLKEREDFFKRHQYQLDEMARKAEENN
ncbi:MAG: class I tRNA ligase family protein [Clostridia bacterium]|nr:class I tRNA ligase family protein [Clostridia bacterium]